MGTTSYEGIIVSSIGQFGLSQFLIVLTVKLSIVIVAYAMVMTSMIGAEPKWWKGTPYINSTTNLSSTSWEYKVCPESENDSGIIVFDDSIYTIVTEWNLICEKAWIPRTIMTIQMTGAVLGPPIIGQLSDSFGRKKSMIGTYTLVLLSVLGHGFSLNWHTMIVFAFFLGFGIGGFLVCCNIYYLEFVGTKWRTLTGAIPAWAAGLMLLGGVFQIKPSWRYLCYTNFAIGCPLLILYGFSPESIRWLFAHGRTEKAKQTLETLAHRNKLPTPNFDAIDEVLREDIAMERHKKKYNYITLVTNKFTRWRILIFGFIWFSMSFGYYAITFGVGTFEGHVGINMVMQGAVEIFAVLLVILLAKHTGRRCSSIVFITLTSCSLFGITIAFHVADPKTYGISKTVLALMSKFFISATWVNIMLFTIETFPTVVRNVAYGLANVFSRVGGALAPQNIALHEIVSHLPFTFNGTLQIISALLCLCLADTYSVQLEDHLQEDGQDESCEALIANEEGMSNDETDQNTIVNALDSPKP